MVIKLHQLKLSPPAYAALMACEIHQVPVELIDIDLMAGDQFKPEYLEKNPIHSVPLLEDGDLIIHDSHVILTYLTDKYGKDDSLYPKDIKKRALVDQKLYYEVLLYTRLRNITVLVYFEGLTQLTDKLVKPLEEAVGFLEAFLSKTKFVVGDTITLADVSISATYAVVRHLISKEKFPKVEAWFNQMEKQPYFQKYGAPGSAGLLKLLTQTLRL